MTCPDPDRRAPTQDQEEIRDLQEQMRNRVREHKETITSLSSVHKRITKSDENILQGFKDMRADFEKYSVKIERRITVLEHWRTALASAWTATVGTLVAWIRYGPKQV